MSARPAPRPAAARAPGVGGGGGGSAGVQGRGSVTSAHLRGGRWGESPLAPPGKVGSRGLLERRFKPCQLNGPRIARVRGVPRGLLPAGGAAARRDGASGVRLPPKRLRGAGPGASWEERWAPSRKAGAEDGSSGNENYAQQ